MISGRACLTVAAFATGWANAASAQDVSEEFANRVMICSAMYTAEEFAKYPTGVPWGRTQVMGEAFNAVIPYDTIETENAFLDKYYIARGEFMELFYDNPGLDENMPASLVQVITMCEETYAEVVARGIE